MSVAMRLHDSSGVSKIYYNIQTSVSALHVTFSAADLTTQVFDRTRHREAMMLHFGATSFLQSKLKPAASLTANKNSRGAVLSDYDNTQAHAVVGTYCRAVHADSPGYC